MRNRTIALAATVACVAVGVGAGAAVAGGGSSGQQKDGKGRCARMLERVAEAQGITVTQLEASIRARLLAAIDAAERAGRIDAKRAATLRERVATGNLCRALGAAWGHGHGHPGLHLRHRAVKTMFRGAARYLGLTPAQLRTELRAGKSLAALSEAQGKTLAGLKEAMLAPVAATLDRLVTKGRISDARRDAILERLGRLADRLIVRQRTAPATT